MNNLCFFRSHLFKYEIYKFVFSLYNNWIEENKYDFLVAGKVLHIENTLKIAKILDSNDDLLYLCMLFHDIGRIKQFEKIKSFDDKIISHQELGAIYFDELKNLINLSDEEKDIIRNVILYHGLMEKIETFSNDDLSRKYLEIATVIDRIENGCVGAPNYISYEIDNDLKHFKEKNFFLDMRVVSEDVLENFINNKPINKYTQCKTYADYIVFALYLAKFSINSDYKEIATLCLLTDISSDYPFRNLENSSYNKYLSIIDKYITKEQAKIVKDNFHYKINIV